MDKTFSPAEAEARIAALWEAAGAFRAGANATPGAEAFSIVIPPPNVTGALHMGHAFNTTLQDILVRWHRMRGFDTLWQPGLDHAGIATQMVVERELAKTDRRRTDFSREEFIAKVWDWKGQSGGTIVSQLKRLGASADFSREAFTMDPHFQRAVLEVFVKFYNDGLIFRGKRLVNWDPLFETAISDLEVENRETPGHMWHFRYPLAGGATYEYVEKDAEGRETLRETRDYISIATTRPETMLGDGAVAVHRSDARYASIVGMLCEIPVGPKEHRRLIPIITDEYPDPLFGSGAVKITGAHDFNDYAVAQRNGIPLYALMDTRARMRADGLSYEESAGIAGAIARREREAGDVSQVNLVPEELRGLDRLEARAKVVEQITAEGLAVMVPADDPRLGRAAAAAGAPGESYEEGGMPPELHEVPLVEPKAIMQPFGDRSNVVIEPMLTDQWFVDTARIVQPAIDAVRDGRTAILPERDAKTYFHWLENIEPWCISRQLWWGHQIPVWYGLDLNPGTFADDEGDDALDEVEILGLLLQRDFVGAEPRHHCAVDVAGVTAAFHADIAALPAPLQAARVIEVADAHAAVEVFAASLAEYNLSQDSTHLVYPIWRDPDVLDTWFSSGLWPLGTLGWPEATPELARYFPTSVLVTGFDIIFFWVARMMMMQLELVKEVPFRTVYVHALVRDASGKKMSKSLGNVLDPNTLIDEYGADAVRFTLAAMAAMGRDLKLSTARINGYRSFGTKLWNAHRFAEMNGVFEAPRDGIPMATAPVNRWIIGETGRVREAVDEALGAYRFNDAANALHGFVWGIVCDWYVEFSKPLLQGDDTSHKAETQATMAWVLDQCLILMHPFTPFITEDLWGAVAARAKLLAHADWPTYGADLVDAEAEGEMRWTIALVDGVRSARAQMNVPAGLTVPVLMTDADDAARQALSRNEALIRRLARVEAIAEGPAPRGSITVAAPGATFALPLAGLIDIVAETARMTKALDAAVKQIGALRGRLSNAGFVASAPEEVIEEARENLAAREAEVAQLRAALARLAELG